MSVKNIPTFYLKDMGKETKLTMEFMKKNAPYLRWDRIIMYQKLTEEQLIIFNKYIDWDLAIEKQIITPKIFEKFSNRLDWSKLSRTKKFSEEELIQYEKYIDWSMIPYNSVPIELLDAHSDDLNWKILIATVKLPENFLRKHIDKIPFKLLVTQQKLSEDFILEYFNQLDWIKILKHQKLSDEFVDKYYDKIPDIPKKLIYVLYHKSLLPKTLVGLDWNKILSEAGELKGNLIIKYKKYLTQLDSKAAYVYKSEDRDPPPKSERIEQSFETNN